MLPVIVSVMIVYLVAGIFYFGAKKPGYHHLRYTISELGEDGAPHQQQVNWLLFFPVGAGLFILCFFYLHNETFAGLAACMGAGYMISAFFPCDKGAPMSGSLKTSVHNAAGLIEYGGSMLFLYKSGPALQNSRIFDPLFSVGVIAICLVGFAAPGSKYRGWFQRVAETVLFGELLGMSLS